MTEMGEEMRRELEQLEREDAERRAREERRRADEEERRAHSRRQSSNAQEHQAGQSAGIVSRTHSVTGESPYRRGCARRLGGTTSAAECRTRRTQRRNTHSIIVWRRNRR